VQKGKSSAPLITATEPVKLVARSITDKVVKSSPKVTVPLVASARLRIAGSNAWKKAI
jgi:hypothetical protein